SRRAGEALARAKATAGHGNWLAALEQTGIPQQRASEYMRLAAGWDKLPPGGDFTLKGALALLAEDGRDEGGSQQPATRDPRRVEDTTPRTAEPASGQEPDEGNSGEGRRPRIEASGSGKFLTLTFGHKPAGNETFEALQERDHDDVVLAVASAAAATI